MRTDLYLVHEGRSASIDRRIDAFARACAQLQVELHVLDALIVDYTSLPRLGPNDMLYRVSRGGHVLENLLVGPGVATFHADAQHIELNTADTTTLWSIVHERVGLPVPRTVHRISRERDQLDRYAAWVGGFPIVLKVSGGTLGVGVVRVDSRAALYSAADFLLETGRTVSMREYIADANSVRLIVVGDRVVASIRYHMPEGDFRANAADRASGEPFSPSESLCADAVRAVRAIGLSAGAVDVAVDRDDRHFVLETNFPFGLAVVDAAAVAIEMVSFLRAKK